MLTATQRVLRFRGLLGTLTQRELKARYRGSALGFFWSLVNPLLLTAVYTLVFGWILAPSRGTGPQPYALFLISGLFPWLWVSSSLLEGTVSLVANSGLIRKAVFPVELPPLVAVLANLIHFLLAVPILLLALAAGRLMGYPVGGWGLLLLPVVVALQLPMVAGIALALSALNVLFKDVRDLVQNGLTLLFFLAPIIYPLHFIPIEALRWVVRLNPFTPYVLGYQAVLFDGVAPDLVVWGEMIVFSLAFWALGTWLFERLREVLVEIA
ncbi:MAG: ABC transporter permease [Acidobacteria bacterium]|nr:ABC transporter permease [Acidobacteriota bacterium]